MTTAQVGYAHVHRWVKEVLGSTHTTVIMTVAWAASVCWWRNASPRPLWLGPYRPSRLAWPVVLTAVRRWWQGSRLSRPRSVLP